VRFTDAPGLSVPETPLAVEAVRAFPKLKFKLPIVIDHAGDGTDRVFIADQQGTIHVIPNRDDVAETKPFLDIEERVAYKDAENEEGLLGLAFHPKYKQNGEFFLYYTTTAAPHTSVVSRFRVSKDDPNRADPKSEEEILRIPQPYWNHNGGTLAFGPDGYLYIGLGDGGLGGDPHKNGQSLKTLLGKILRIDVDHADAGKKYAIPKDNPFAGMDEKARGEIWALGLRNVWRMSFDRQTGNLWAADVGQDLWEEVNLIRRGGNYGWSLREGRHPFGPGGVGPNEIGARSDLIDPVFEYHHSIGKSITGGHVYRGKQVPPLAGTYLYADYITGKLYALRYDDKSQKAVANHTIAGPNLPVMTYGEDQSGEAYFAVRSGQIYRFRCTAK
jgi:quinoprotein glucose dehydrogenase